MNVVVVVVLLLATLVGFVALAVASRLRPLTTFGHVVYVVVFSAFVAAAVWLISAEVVRASSRPAVVSTSLVVPSRVNYDGTRHAWAVAYPGRDGRLRVRQLDDVERATNKVVVTVLSKHGPYLGIVFPERERVDLRPFVANAVR